MAAVLCPAAAHENRKTEGCLRGPLQYSGRVSPRGWPRLIHPAPPSSASALGAKLQCSPDGSEGPVCGETNRDWKKKWLLAAAGLPPQMSRTPNSSRRGDELHPPPRGLDGHSGSAKAVVLRSAASGGRLISQVIRIKKMPAQNLYRPFAVTPAAAAGFAAVSATRNYTLQRANKLAYLPRQGMD